ncbi:MAG TPA: hybrid sensor histidine kinase/response regulator [Planctomycetes bacterium]|nr:hybrid sensor histidine kinase/response regulator [Planctomycetota bacterium]
MMQLLAIQKAAEKGEGTETFIPHPMSSAPVSIGGGAADVPLKNAGDALASVLLSDEGLTISPRSGGMKINDRPLSGPAILRPGGVLTIGGHRLALEDAGGFVLRELTPGRAAEKSEAADFGSGFEVLCLPLGVSVQSHPLKSLNAMKDELHLKGVVLLHKAGGSSGTAEFAAGERYAGDVSQSLAAIKNEMLYMRSQPEESLVAVGHNWPEGGSSALLAWADRPVSIGYMANVYRRLPEALSALLVQQKTDAVFDEVMRERLSAAGMLASGMAHIFNNMLGSIYGYAQLAATRRDFTDKLISSVNESVKRSHRVLDMLACLSPHHSRSRTRISVTACLEDILALTEAEAARRDVRVVFLRSGVVSAAYGDPANVYQLLLALVLRGLECTPEYGLLTIKEVAEEGRVTVRFTAEAGEGAQAAAAANAPCAQAGEKPLPLNVMLARRLAETIGAHLVFSASGHAEFKLVLPVVQEGTAPAEAPHTARQQKSASILVVDDEQDYQMLVAYSLRPHAVDCASSAKEAIELLKNKTYEAVVLDLLLKEGGSGEDVFHCIKEAAPSTRVVIITGAVLKGAERERYEGAAAILAKPFEIGELRSALKL